MTDHLLLDLSMRLNLQLLGSFQSPAAFFYSENPAQEVWDRIEKLGTQKAISRLVPDSPNAKWQEYLDYAGVRISQALEFRAASIGRSLLTAPLPLYYAFLSAMRAYLALVPEILPSPKHGLRFIPAGSLVESKAALASGTFSDYLTAEGIAWASGEQISLKHAIGHIPELYDDVYELDKALCFVQVVYVDATMNTLHLRFPRYPRDFASEWSDDFPALRKPCTATPDGRLEVSKEHFQGRDADISRFLSIRLLPQLHYSQSATWYSFRALDQPLKLDRLAYYFVAMFILGSAVRYQPELVLKLNARDSQVGWLLRRFLSQADRYFPQLLLWQQSGGQQLYFGNQGT